MQADKINQPHRFLDKEISLRPFVTFDGRKRHIRLLLNHTVGDLRMHEGEEDGNRTNIPNLSPAGENDNGQQNRKHDSGFNAMYNSE
ncbi:MAG: hypothetical protein JWO78_2179 [Micavibrio sp.]|nr:hypothetical protein [Micavibrio sp.]